MRMAMDYFLVRVRKSMKRKKKKTMVQQKMMMVRIMKKREKIITLQMIQ